MRAMGNSVGDGSSKLFFSSPNLPDLGRHIDHCIERTQFPFAIQQPCSWQRVTPDAAQERAFPPRAVENDRPLNLQLRDKPFERLAVSIKTDAHDLHLFRREFR